MSQVFDLPPQACIQDGILPILSLRMQDLCYLHEMNDTNFTPYQKDQCEMFARGIAKQLQMKYIPMQGNKKQAHVWWIVNTTLTWLELNHDNLLGQDFVCLKNFETNILNKKEEQLIFRLNKYYELLNVLQKYFKLITWIE